jgi:hypothetical protein
MSYDVHFTGQLDYPTKKLLQAAVTAMDGAIADEDDCDSFVTVADLATSATSISVDVAGSCPATMWEETLAFLEILAEGASAGIVSCFFEGELTETIKGNAVPVPSSDPPKAKPRRSKADPSALRWAAQFGELDKVETLLAAGTDPNAPDPANGMGTTALMMAAYHGKPAIIERLIAAGADMDRQDEMGNSALFHAASNKNKRGRKRCLELLIAADANPELRNRGNDNAVQYARQVRACEGADELVALTSTARRQRTYGGKKLVPRT